MNRDRAKFDCEKKDSKTTEMSRQAQHDSLPSTEQLHISQQNWPGAFAPGVAANVAALCYASSQIVAYAFLTTPNTVFTSTPKCCQ